jgi:DNA-binding NtrC family response regulator
VKRELDNLVTSMHTSGITYDEAVREFKRRFILEVLSGNRGNQCKAAKELGVHRNTLSRILNELKIDPAQVRTGLRRPPQRERGPIDRQRTERA